MLASIARYWILVLAIVLVCAGAGYALSSSRPTVYRATATIFLSDAAVDAGRQDRNVQQEANRLQSRSVYDRAAELVGEPVESVTVEADPTVGVIDVTASSGDREQAATIATSVARAYEQIRQEGVDAQITNADKILRAQSSGLSKQITKLEKAVAADPNDQQSLRQMETLRAQLIALQTRISEMSVDASLSGAGIDEIEEAVPPQAPSSPQPLRDASIAAIVGLLMGATLAFWRAGVNARATFDPGMVLGAPLLAQIPDFGSNGTAPADLVFETQVTEAYQFLLSSIEYALGRHGASSILVSSASPGEGKSLTALHLARALAVQGRDVTLVDSDIRARGLTSLLNAEGEPGLVALADGAPAHSVVRQYRITDSSRLSVIPAGQPPTQVAGLLATPRYRDAIAKVIGSSGITIIDSAPLLTVADASAIATQAAGILLVVDARASEWDLRRLHDRLRLISTPILGYVVNRAQDTRAAPHQYGVTEPSRSLRSRLFAQRGSSRRPLPSEPMARAEQG